MEKSEEIKQTDETSHDFEGFENLPDEVKAFLKYHGPQLINNGFPMTKELVESLYRKLVGSVYDTEDRNNELYCLQALSEVKKEEDVFIIDHFFSFRYEELRKKIANEKKLRNRLNKMLKFWKEKQTLKDSVVRPNNVTDPKLHPDFDYQDINDIRNLDLDWENIITLSLCGCKITNPDVIAVMLPKMPNLKALWINDNPCVKTEENKKLFRVFIENHHSGVQIVNSKFTKNTKEWGILYSTFGGNMQMVENYDINELVIVDISDRDFANMKDNIEILYNLPKVTHVKCYGTAFNSYGETNRFFSMIKAMQNLKHFEMDYYLLDLFWKIKDRIKILNANLKYINGYDLGFSQPKEYDEETDFIVENIWKILGSYRIATTGNMVDKLPIFYVQDEVGNAIVHSATPNIRNTPFLWFPYNDPLKGCKTVNLFWPIRDIKEAEFITDDKLLGLNENIKYAKEGLWDVVETEVFMKAYKEKQEKMKETFAKGKVLIEEGLELACKPDPIPSSFKGEKFKVFTDVKNLPELLTLPEFEVTDNMEEADIIWLNKNLKYTKISEEKLKTIYKNQLPFEACLVDKGFFLDTINSTIGQPDWLTISYSLNNEMNAFVGEYLHRKANFLPNFWITKPVRSTRGAEMAITDNLDLIIRSPELGPKIASKYLENPLRFRGSKFDMRFFVLIRSIEPLEVYVHNIFLLNVSRNDFTLDKRRLFQYDTHFTGLEIKWHEFIKQFEQKHKIKFDEIKEKIYSLLRESIILAKSKYPNMQDEYSRGFYGIDTILDTEMNPKLLEFTFAPDCTRAGLYHENFWNEIFGCMFLGKFENMERIL